MPSASGRSTLGAIVAIGGGLVFAGSLLYFARQYTVGFDAPAVMGDRTAPVFANIVLFTIFALHHSVFARSGFKEALTRVIPPSMERSTYVWIASVLFIGVCWAWQPVPGVAWEVSGGLAWVLRAIQLASAVLTVAAARHLDVLDLAGIRQALGLPSSRPMKLDDHGPYGFVRHPIYLCWVLMVWAAPHMNGTRLLFAAISTLYLIAAIPFEERDLRKTFGTAYDDYAVRVPRKVIPWLY